MLRVTNKEESGGALAKLPMFGAVYGSLNVDDPPANIVMTIKERAMSGNDALGGINNFQHSFFVTAQGGARSVVLKCFNEEALQRWLSALASHRSSVEKTVNKM